MYYSFLSLPVPSPVPLLTSHLNLHQLSAHSRLFSSLPILFSMVQCTFMGSPNFHQFSGTTFSLFQPVLQSPCFYDFLSSHWCELTGFISMWKTGYKTRTDQALSSGVVITAWLWSLMACVLCLYHPMVQKTLDGTCHLISYRSWGTETTFP